MDDAWYEGEPMVIDESDPSTWRLKEKARPVFFENSSKDAPDWSLLRNALRTSRNRLSVKRVCLGRTSRMTELQLIPVFREAESVEVLGDGVNDLSPLTDLPQLRTLSLQGRRSRSCSLALLPELPLKELWLRAIGPQDISHVNTCRGLDCLGIYRYPFADMGALSGIHADILHLVGGKLEYARGISPITRATTKFTKCRDLVDLTDLPTTYLELTDCHKVDLHTLSGVHGLRLMWICGRRLIESWDFITDCRTLEHLVVSGARIATQDWRPIVDSRSLRLAWLGHPVSDRVIHELGTANPQLVVTNGHVCMSEGRRSEVASYYQHREMLPLRRKAENPASRRIK